MMKYIVGGLSLLFVFMIGSVVMVFMILLGDDDDPKNAESPKIITGPGAPVNDEVKRYKDLFTKYAKKNDIGDQVNVLMALTMQESGGKSSDIMQSSESLGKPPNTITDPKKSIRVGVKYYSEMYKKADKHTKTALQGYNMGGGFIAYAKKQNDGKYKHKLAKQFSEKQKQKTGSVVYGDPDYVQHVTRYLGNHKKRKVKKGQWGFPVKGQPIITSPYGHRHDPFGGGGGDMHYGLDFDCSSPDPIVAVHDGTIFKTGINPGGWGNYVVVENNKQELSLYGHMSKIKASKGNKVKQGDQIGVCGQTGGATGEHVHLEYWNSEKGATDHSHRKNPKKMLNLKGVKHTE